MYIAMNRFRVILDKEETFETIWRSRESRLKDVPGYLEFHLLKGPKAEDHTLYASHTLWESYDDFVAWTKSDAFRLALPQRVQRGKHALHIRRRSHGMPGEVPAAQHQGKIVQLGQTVCARGQRLQHSHRGIVDQ